MREPEGEGTDQNPAGEAQLEENRVKIGVGGEGLKGVHGRGEQERVHGWVWRRPFGFREGLHDVLPEPRNAAPCPK